MKRVRIAFAAFWAFKIFATNPPKDPTMALTDKQRKFAVNIANGMTATDAARASGYADSSPHALRVTASRLQHHPDVKKAAFLERERRLNGPLASLALQTLQDVMTDLSAPPAARIQAARFTLEAAGHGVVNRQLAARHPEDGDKPLSSFTVQELEEMVAGAEMRMKQAQGQVIEADATGEGEVT